MFKKQRSPLGKTRGRPGSSRVAESYVARAAENYLRCSTAVVFLMPSVRLMYKPRCNSNDVFLLSTVFFIHIFYFLKQFLKCAEEPSRKLTQRGPVFLPGYSRTRDPEY